MINTVRRFDKTKPHDTVNTIDGRPRLAFLSTTGSFYCTKRPTICYYMNVLLFFRSRVWRTRDNQRTSRTRYMVSVILQSLLRHLSQVRQSIVTSFTSSSLVDSRHQDQYHQFPQINGNKTHLWIHKRVSTVCMLSCFKLFPSEQTGARSAICRQYFHNI